MGDPYSDSYIIAIVRVSENRFAQFDCRDLSEETAEFSMNDPTSFYHEFSVHQIAFSEFSPSMNQSRLIFSITVDLADGRDLTQLDGMEIRKIIGEVYAEQFPNTPRH